MKGQEDTQVEEEGAEVDLESARRPTTTDEEPEQRGVPSAIKAYWISGDLSEFIGCLLFFILCAIPSVAVPHPRERPIPYQQIKSGEFILNQVLNEIFDKDTISDLVLLCLCGFLPLLSQMILAKLWLKKPKDAHATICAYLVGFAMTMLITDSVKNYVGYLRPSFYDLCQPTPFDFTTCNTQDSDDARKSFPSGHASLAFCGLSLLAKYLERTFGLSSITQVSADETNSTIVMKYNTEKSLRFHRIYSILCLLPYALAIFVASSRVVDNKHFPADVVGGALVGAACAHVGHGLWFMPLSVAM